MWTPTVQAVLSLVSLPFRQPGPQSRLSLREIVNAAMSARCQRGVTALHSFLFYDTLFPLWREKGWIAVDGLTGIYKKKKIK